VIFERTLVPQERYNFIKDARKIKWKYSKSQTKMEEMPIPNSMLAGTSFACFECSLRASARKLIPKAFTKHAAARPLVRARLPRLKVLLFL